MPGQNRCQHEESVFIKWPFEPRHKTGKKKGTCETDDLRTLLQVRKAAMRRGRQAAMSRAPSRRCPPAPSSFSFGTNPWSFSKLRFLGGGTGLRALSAGRRRGARGRATWWWAWALSTARLGCDGGRQGRGACDWATAGAMRWLSTFTHTRKQTAPGVRSVTLPRPQAISLYLSVSLVMISLHG